MSIIYFNNNKSITILSYSTFTHIIVRNMGKVTDTGKKVLEAATHLKPTPPATPPVIPSKVPPSTSTPKSSTVTPPSSQPQTKAVDSPIVKSAKEHEKAVNQSSFNAQPNATPSLSDGTKDSSKNPLTNLGINPEANAMAKALFPHLEKNTTVANESTVSNESNIGNESNESMEIPTSSTSSTSSTPPTPPPLPPKSPNASNKVTDSNNKAFTEQIKSFSSEDDNSNIKPSVVKTKFEYKIPTTTKITKDTTSSDLSVNEALFELKMRGLLKDDKDKNIVSFKTESGEDLPLVVTF